MNGLQKTSASKYLLVGIFACLVIGCSKKVEETRMVADEVKRQSSAPAVPDPPDPHPPVKKVADINDPAFHNGLMKAAEKYLEYGLVDTRIHVAPAACAPAVQSGSPNPRPTISTSEDESTHGKKLYFLFAKEIAHYLDQDGSDSPIGQVVVKESWTSKTAHPDARNLRNHACGIRINPRITFDGKTQEIGKRKELFVMMKLEEDTPGTDEGWVYGVVTPGGEQVLSSGKAASCMECHVDAKHDRLFGPVLSADIPQSSNTNDG